MATGAEMMLQSMLKMLGIDDTFKATLQGAVQTVLTWDERIRKIEADNAEIKRKLDVLLTGQSYTDETAKRVDEIGHRIADYLEEKSDGKTTVGCEEYGTRNGSGG
jgi:hypothetical protein